MKTFISKTPMRGPFTILSASLSAMLSLTTPAAAEAPASILVLDASGSMWGQIDGTAKITIARDVIGQLLDDLPQTQRLGLTAYGHRRKGDCSDIETLVPPGENTRDAIASAVAGLSPKGKTPMSDAVVAAATALRHSENAATVILVSDGIETCADDPCAIATELEATGVAFTAHVVGFDIDDPQAQAQLQCIAAETGGSYRPASDAGELAEALRELASAPAPAPEAEPTPGPAALPPLTLSGPAEAPAGTIPVIAITGAGNDEDFIALYDASGVQVSFRTRVLGDEIAYQLPETPGSYEFRYIDRGANGTVRATLPITLTESGPSLSAPDRVAAGSSVTVTWTGPGTDWDFLTIARPDDGGGYLTASDYIASAGSPVTLSAPSAPGAYEIRYIFGENREILVRRAITVE